MVLEIRPNVVDGHLLKWMLAAGVSWLENHKQQVNNMNVFPVPDGDTGTNMVLTIRKAYQQVAHLNEDDISLVSESIARGALTGARGNSGTILSMLLRGFAQGLQGQDVMDSNAFVRACQNAVDYAYDTVRSVMDPVEGTILTVARESATAIKEHAKSETDLRKLFDHLLDAAYVSLENTPNLLPKLKEAGVVDSGGMGLVYILEGMRRLMDGKPIAAETTNGHKEPSEAVVVQEPHWQEALEPDDEEGYGYDVQFLMLGENMDVKQVREDISNMGWSPLIDGDDRLIKVHIHVHDPGEPLSYAIGLGVELDDIVVENMQAQYLQYVQQRQQREAHNESHQVDGVAVVTVARGDGLQVMLQEYGAARVIVGGQTMNPSTEDFLAAIDSLNASEIILLPNNGNVIMAAQQAASLAHGNTVRVVPTKTVQQGIAALLSYMDVREHGTLDEIYETMCESFTHLISAEVTTATRDASIDGVSVTEGQLIGLVNGKLRYAGGTLPALVQRLLEECHAEEHELVTLYYGNGQSEGDAHALVAQLESVFEDLSFEVVYGGQPLYPYLISIE